MSELSSGGRFSDSSGLSAPGYRAMTNARSGVSMDVFSFTGNQHPTSERTCKFKRVNYDKTTETSAKILTPQKRSFIPDLRQEKWLYLKFWANVNPFLRKRRFPVTITPSATAVSISTYNVVIDMPYYYYYLCWRRQLVDQFYACFHVQTRNTYRGTWYLPHSHVYNERTVPIIMAGCMAHERKGYISTSGLKYDLAVVFLDPDFL